MWPNMREIIALIYTLGYFGFLVLIVFHDLPVDGEDTLKILLGVMSTAEVAIVQYYFGASQSDTARAVPKGGANGASVSPAPVA